MPAFGTLLKQHIAKAGMTQRAFARAAGEASSYVSEIANERRRPPLDDSLLKWAHVLNLDDNEQVTFFEAALIAHAPKVMQVLSDLQARRKRHR